MSAALLPESKSVDRLAFEHYLRTGERLTSRQWRARHEQKFNPYHDQRGRFTTANGATSPVWHPDVAAPSGKPEALALRPAGVRRDVGNKPDLSVARTTPGRASDPSPDSGANGFRSNFIRDRVESQTSNADSYFELNKRQAQLDLLRREAGPNPHPAVRADLDDFQRRLDANRSDLDARSKVADRAITELLRAGLAPVDIAVGAANIATGNAELRDYLSVGAVIPFAGVVSKVGGLTGRAKVRPAVVEPQIKPAVQLGGPYKVVRKLRGYHAHHLIADSISPIPKGEGATIAMLPEHHVNTGSYGRSADAAHFRSLQKERMDMGDHAGAMKLGIDDVRSRHGDMYDEALQQATMPHPKKGAK